jgi:diguanylate cyclase (GGDEF)-like protein/PAS domain S-box-containing protein
MSEHTPPGGPIDPAVIFEAILENSISSLVVFDHEGRVLRMSRSAEELMQTPAEHFAGRRIDDFVTEDMREHLSGTLAGRTSWGEGPFHSSEHGTSLWMRSRWAPLRDAEGAILGGLLIAVDATQQKQAEARAERLAFVDPVTGLPNRTMATMMLSRALTGAKGGRRQLGLVWLNLDRFKDVNDALGSAAGDALLQAVGERLLEAVRTNDLVARLGGDDFLLMLPRIVSQRSLERLIARIHAVFETPFVVDSESVLLTASCGIAVHPNGGSTAHELEEHAHTAMRAAKRLGGGACEIFDAGLVDDSSQRLRLVREIRDGIDQGQFELHYQPQVDLHSLRVQAMEALVRWQHPQRGLLPPSEFIAFAEETALIVPLGQHLFEQACRHHAGWRRLVDKAPRLAINISSREFQRSDVSRLADRAAKTAGIPLSAIEIEITETAVLADPAHAAEVAAGLRAVGATVALDDFGTGYSSLTHLRELPIDRVKVDRSFVASCLDDRSAAAILVGVTRIAHDLGIEVVAEGVETEAQLSFVRAVGCDAAQGYHLSRPLPHDQCSDYLLRAAEGPVL